MSFVIAVWNKSQFFFCWPNISKKKLKYVHLPYSMRPVKVPNVNSCFFFRFNWFKSNMMFVIYEFQLFNVDVCCGSSNSLRFNFISRVMRYFREPKRLDMHSSFKAPWKQRLTIFFFLIALFAPINVPRVKLR